MKVNIFRGYNYANVNYAYGINVGNVLNEKNEGNYKFLVVNGEVIIGYNYFHVSEVETGGFVIE